MWLVDLFNHVWDFISGLGWKDVFIFLVGMVAGMKIRSRWKRSVLNKGYKVTRKMMIGR